METSGRRFRNLISTAQLVKQMRQRGYENNFTEQALYILFDRYGITAKTKRGGKSYFNRKNACNCVERHIFELHEIAEELKKKRDNNITDTNDNTESVGFGRDDMDVVSRELLANDGVFGADENELYRTNEGRKTIHISEEKYHKLFKINEDVFASKKTGKNKLQLTYNKRANTNRTRNLGQLNPLDTIDTGKMDQDNEDTFVVPLKGGIPSYNITSIKGTEIMHYFKNKFAKMNLDLDGDGVKETYDLWMEDPEYRAFMDQFCNKVNRVITYAIGKMGNKEEFTGISIYPVPSHSNFNETMVNSLVGKVNFAGLPTVKINQEMFQKDQSTMKADEDFMNKNASYFDDRMFSNGNDSSTHRDNVYKTVSKMNQVAKIKELVAQYNTVYDALYRCLKVNRKKYGERFPEALARFYQELANIYDKINASIYYEGGRINNAYSALKGTKTPSEQKNTEEVWQIVRPFFRGSGQKKIPMHKLQVDDFQIKNLSNDIRMGMMGYFNANDKVVEQELKKIKGTVFVIFDDNISGGATLSDICYNAKQLGINYIIPITFGEMRTKYTLGPGKVVNKPQGGKFENY